MKTYEPAALFEVRGNGIDPCWWLAKTMDEAMEGARDHHMRCTGESVRAGFLLASVFIDDIDCRIKCIDEESGSTSSTTIREFFANGGECGYFSSMEA